MRAVPVFRRGRPPGRTRARVGAGAMSAAALAAAAVLAASTGAGALAPSAGTEPSAAEAGHRSAAGPVLRGKGRELQLDLGVELAPAAPGAPAGPLAWRQEGDAAVGETADALREVEVRVVPRGVGLSVEVRVRYREAVRAEREAVRLRLPGSGFALGRDLVWSPLRRPLRVDRGTPVLAVAGDLLVAGGPGIVAARYAPRTNAAAAARAAVGTATAELAAPGNAAPGNAAAGNAAPGNAAAAPVVAGHAAGAGALAGAAPASGVDVELVLDDEAAHPFAVYEQCLPKLPEGDDGQVSYRTLERKRPEGKSPRRPGEEVRGRATLYLLAAGQARLPLVPERWPGGARAAVVFTDHADRTDPEALRAVLHGDSRPVCRAAGPGGFLGRGLKLTKSFFVRARRGGLEEPETAALARELAAAGSEVASHSPTAAADDRETARRALVLLRDFGAVTWIDHQPYTNCEAISSEGWRDDGPYAIRDLVVAAGFRWVWEAGDVGGFGAEPAVGNLFHPARPSAAPPLYPLPFDARLWAFGSTMFQGTPEALGRALSDAALSQLEAERGLFVAHTYLSASPRTTSTPGLAERLVVRPVEGGVEIHPEFDAALARIAARVEAGSIASLTWDQAGSRLRALGDVEVEYRADGSAVLVNHGAEALEALTVAVPAPGWALEAEGRGALDEATEGGGTRAWLDLPAGGAVVLHATRAGARVPFLRPVPAAVHVPPAETP